MRWFFGLVILFFFASGLLVARAVTPPVPNVKLLDSQNFPLTAPSSKVLPGTFSLVGSEFRINVPPGARLALTIGSSMRPLAGEGHLVVYAPIKVEELRVGDFVVFHACGLKLDQLLFLHQLVGISPSSAQAGWRGVTKGIAEHEAEVCRLMESDILGRAFLIVWGD